MKTRRILCVGDIHGSMPILRTFLRRLPKKCDMVLMPGDLAGSVHTGLVLKSIVRHKRVRWLDYVQMVYGSEYDNFLRFQLKTTERTVRMVASAVGKDIPVFCTHGNTEMREVRTLLHELDQEIENLHYLQSDWIETDGVFVGGMGFVQPATHRTAFATPGEQDTHLCATQLQEIRKQAEHSNSDFKALIVHEPPLHSKLDYIDRKQMHSGASYVNDELNSGTYDIVACGHIHESPGTQRFGKRTIAVNPGALVEGRFATVDFEEASNESRKASVRHHKISRKDVVRLVYAVRSKIQGPRMPS